MTQTVYVEHI